MGMQISEKILAQARGTAKLARSIHYRMASRKHSCRIAETGRYDLDSNIAKDVLTKDVFLRIAETYGDTSNQHVDFGGAAIPHLSIDATRSVTTMAAKLSAEF